MPDRHSTPASPASTICATNASHATPANADTTAKPSCKWMRTPSIASWMTRPGQPASPTTRLEPPPSTKTRSRAPSASASASRSSSTEVTRTNRRAGPPRPSVVSGASGTSWATASVMDSPGLTGSPRDRRARLVDPHEVLLGRRAEPLLEQIDHLVAHELDVAGAERDHEVALLGLGVEPRGQVLPARDVGDVGVAGLAREPDQHLARHALDRLLAGGEDVADHDLVA